MNPIRTPSRPRGLHACALVASALPLLLAGCATPPPPTVSVAQLMQQPGERALVEGLRQYEAGAFEPAETSLRAALAAGLADPRDTGAAQKLLAFIACAFNRLGECEEHFRLAFAADPAFRLTDAEIGHPVWGPVYRRVAESVGAAQRTR